MSKIFNFATTESVLNASSADLFIGVWQPDASGTFQLIDLLDEIDTLLLVYKYVAVSTFSLTIPYNTAKMINLKAGNMLTIHSPQTVGIDETECFLIETVTFTETDTGVTTIKLTGKNPLVWLKQRVALTTNDGYTNTTCEIIAKNYVWANLGSIANPKRQYPNLAIADIQGYGPSITFVNTDDYPTIFSICETALNAGNLGQNITFDLNSQTFTYNVLQGVNRSINQSENLQVLFSPSLDNMEGQTFTNSKANYANVVYVYAQIGDDNNLYSEVVGDATGLNRIETSTSGDLSEGSTVSLTVDNYPSIFQTIGEYTLVKKAETKNTVGTIKLSSSFIFNTDFSLGDTVTYQYKDWGINMDAVISEVRFQYSSSGFTMQVSLGYPLPTLEDKLGVVLS